MTEYRNLYVDKRSFTVLVSLPALSDVQHRMTLADEDRIVRNGETRIVRNGETRIVRVTALGYPRSVSVKKRSFTVLVNKQNGS